MSPARTDILSASGTVNVVTVPTSPPKTKQNKNNKYKATAHDGPLRGFIFLPFLMSLNKLPKRTVLK